MIIFHSLKQLCNCRRINVYSIVYKCLTENIVYQATVKIDTRTNIKCHLNSIRNSDFAFHLSTSDAIPKAE